MKDKQQCTLQCSGAAFSTNFFGLFANLPFLFFCDRVHINVKFKIVWRNALGSLLPCLWGFILQALQEKCSWLLFPEEQARNPFPAVVLPTWQWWWSPCCKFLYFHVGSKKVCTICCQTLALCQSSEAGRIALSFWARSISLISYGFFCVQL